MSGKSDIGDEMDERYEMYREVYTVTEWKDGAIYATRSEGEQWVDEAIIKANRTSETNLIYAPISTKSPNANMMTIRHKTA